MRLFRKKITEFEMASGIVTALTADAKDALPDCLHIVSLGKTKQFSPENEAISQFDLFLAVLSLELQAVENLFSKEQASRLRNWILCIVDTEEYGVYALQELAEYKKEYDKSLSIPEMPAYGVAARFLHRLLGGAIHEIVLSKSGIMNPLPIMCITDILARICGKTKHLRDRFRIVRDDIPPEYVQKQEAMVQTITKSREVNEES